MKIALMALAVGLCALTGCVRRYVVSQTNGVKVYTTSKPKMSHGYYVFKDGAGKKVAVPSGDVLQIQPASMENEPGGQFLPTNR